MAMGGLPENQSTDAPTPLTNRHRKRREQDHGAVLEELSGVKTAIDDPMAAFVASVGGQDLQPHQDDIIRRAERYAALGGS